MGRATCYYWTGGREVGRWREALCFGGVTPERQIERLARMGYVAVKGDDSIGAPEGSPSEEEFGRVGV